MKRIIMALLLVTTVNCYAQDSQPSFAFGNNLQGTNGVDGGNINAVQAYTKLQESADAAYKDKSYERAFELYGKLAEFGDKFSQYRMAYMYENGVGTSPDPIKAFAWSYVSAETGKKSLVNYHVGLREKLNESDQKRARELAKEYIEKYGLYAIAYNARELIREQKKSCVGSRVGSSCDRISSSGVTCNAFENNLPGNACLTLGSVGLPSIAGMQPKDVRLVENNLQSIIQQYSPGRIEFRELEVIEDN